MNKKEKVMTLPQRLSADKAQSLANDLNCVISTLQAIADDLAMAYTDSDYDRDEPETTFATAQQKSDPQKQVIFDEVRGVLADKSRAGHREVVQALLSKYGAERLSAVDPAQYASLLADATRVGLTEVIS